MKDRTKKLRKNMTQPEKILWYGFLRGLQKKSHLHEKSPSIEGENSNDSENRGSFRVYRQRPIHNFIVDFYIPHLKIVIEIDGESHFDAQGIEYDKERTAILEGLGLRVIRFTNHEIMNNFECVCEGLRTIII